MSPAPSPVRPRLRSLDALRLVAALAVVLFHFTARGNSRWGVPIDEAFPVLSQVTRFGYAGVHLFFVISGFVVLMSAWGSAPRGFVASRISRLYPAFWAAVLITATLRWWWPTFSDRTPAEVLVNLTMVPEVFGVPRVDGVYWTLWVELQFYLLVLLFVRLGITAWRVLVVATVVPAACTVVTLLTPGSAGILTLLSWAPVFAAGMVLFVIHREGHTPGRWALVALNSAQAVAVSASQKAAAIDSIAPGRPTSPLVLGLVVVVCVALVAVVAFVPVVRDLDWKVLTTAGALTYPLYLTHEYVGWALIEWLSTHVDRYGTLALALLACGALAWGMHHAVERPFQKPFRRFLLEFRLPTRRGRAAVGPGWTTDVVTDRTAVPARGRRAS